MDMPPDGLVRLVAGEVHDGRLSSSVREMLGGVIQSAFREILRDRMRTRLSPVLDDNEVKPSNDDDDDGLETTHEEIEGYLLVKAMLRGCVDVNRVVMRDAKSYCAVLLDDNNRKPLVRLHFNRKQKYVGVFDGSKEERIPISSLDEMLDLAPRIEATAKNYE
jgi:hypothetical protein